MDTQRCGGGDLVVAVFLPLGDRDDKCGAKNCGQSQCRKREEIVEVWPWTLVVMVSRWKPSAAGHRWVKDGAMMRFDNELQLLDSPLYRLSAVIVHIGQQKGHYVSYCKKACGQWFLCEDLDLCEVFQYFGSRTGHGMISQSQSESNGMSHVESQSAGKPARPVSREVNV